MMKNQSKFIPKAGAKQVTPGPPPIDKVLLEKARQVAVALVGFPVDIEIRHKGTQNFFRMGAHLEVVQSNMMVYSYLKEFNVFYMQAHEMTAAGQITFFTDLISAIHDMGAYWAAYGQLDPPKFNEIMAMCRRAMDDVNQETVKLLQQQIQKS